MNTPGISILSLPPEILLEIVKFVLLPDLPRKKEIILNLCLISRRFSDITCPILFSRVSLGRFSSFHRHRTSQLKELSKGDTKASAFAKHLSIDYSSSFSDDDPAKVISPIEKVMLKHLKSAIRSFRAITSMSWNIGQYDPSWVTDSIINELAAIPTLQDINLKVENSSYIRNMDAFSNLRKIRVRAAGCGPDELILELGKLLAHCPGLTDLDIFIEEGSEDNMSQLFQFLAQTGKPHSLRHLTMEGLNASDCSKLAIGNLRSLQSLHIFRFSSRIVIEPTIWDILRKERIHIQNLSTDAPDLCTVSTDDSFLRYLSSFHGLRKFSIISSLRHYPRTTILQVMVSYHADSLIELNMLQKP